MAMTDPNATPLPALRASARGAGRGNAGAGMMSVLSLFLLLLAFFILLNSLARFETTRTQAILGSLYATFNTLDPDGAEREFGSFVGLLAAADALEGELGGRLRTVLEAGRFDLVGDGEVVGLDVAVEDLFDADGAALPRLDAFAAEVAAARGTVPAGYRAEVEVVVPAGTGPIDRRDSATLQRAIAVAGEVVRALDRAGIADRALMAGIGSGPAGRIRIEFRIVDATPVAEGGR